MGKIFIVFTIEVFGNAQIPVSVYHKGDDEVGERFAKNMVLTILLTKDMINKFEFKGKAEKFLQKVDNMQKPAQLDAFAADLMQLAHGNKVVK